MSDCDCEECENEEEEEEEEEQKYEAFMQAGHMAVQIEGETSEVAQERVEEMFGKAVEEVQKLNEEERRSIQLK